MLPPGVARVVSWHSDIVRQRLALAAYGPFVRRFLRSSDAIIAATPIHFSGSTQIPRDFDDARRFVVPYGFEPKEWSITSAAKSRLQMLLEQKRGRFAVFALGRHVYYKGFDVLIQAMRNIDAVLWLGGTGPLTSQLDSMVKEAGIADKVHLVGAIAHTELPAYYEACDVFCLPSTERSEAFGLVQLEAMYFRRPVVATALGTGVEWVNQNGTTGMLVPPKNVSALSQALHQLELDPSMRTRLGDAGHRRVLEHFSSERMVDLTIDVYQRILSTRQTQKVHSTFVESA
jgi:rhamnosyl/mannosyltransferase